MFPNIQLESLLAQLFFYLLHYLLPCHCYLGEEAQNGTQYSRCSLTSVSVMKSYKHSLCHSLWLVLVPYELKILLRPQEQKYC